MSFDGQWATSFGPMTLQQVGNRVTGRYGRNGAENAIEGTVETDKLTFHYEEPTERGTGWFRLKRTGCFAGEYLADGNARALLWQGWRGFDGLWDTSLGRLRLVQEGERVWGSSELDASVRLEGDIEADGRLPFRVEGATLKGGGHLDIDDAGYLLDGEWTEDGQSPGAVRGQRAMPRPGFKWLVVLEAHRQRALDDNEFALGRLLREQLAPLPWTMVRHRYYDDAAGLMRWCRQLLYLPEPSIVLVSGPAATVAAMGGDAATSPAAIVDSLRYADGVKLLHLSAPASLAGQDAARLLNDAPFPVSGYTSNVDWAQCALLEGIYLDMILDKGLTPEHAAAQLPQLVGFAGIESPPGSPYRPAGFTFIGAEGRLAEAIVSPQHGTVSRRLH